MSDSTTLLLSIPLGAISSLIAWWILNHYIKPEIVFSEDISMVFDQAKPFYRFKFENAGKRRILDCEFIVKLRIKGLKFPRTWEVIYLPLDNDKIPIIKSTRKDTKRLREVPRLELRFIDTKYFRFLGSDIQAKIQNDTITLEELMALGDQTELIFYVTGYDEISGAKKTFESKAYKATDIKQGLFNSNGLNVT